MLKDLEFTLNGDLKLKSAKVINKHLITHGVEPKTENLRELGLRNKDIRRYYQYLMHNKCGLRDILEMSFQNVKVLTNNFKF